MAYLGVQPAGITSATQVETDKLNVDNVQVDGNTISSTDTNGDITLDPNGTGDTIVASGNLGVGTSSPGSKLHLQNASGGSEGYLKVTDAVHGGDVRFGIADGVDNDAIAGTFSNNRFKFYTNSTERMRIDSGGNVGIGTTSPQSKLHLNGTGATDAKIELQSGTGVASADGRYGNLILSSDEDNAVAGSLMAFKVDSSEAARIDASGNLLVGTGSFGNVNSNSFGFSPSNKYAAFSHANGTASGTGYISFGYNNSEIGSITQSGTTGVAYNTSSDHRLKENVADMTGAITRVKQLAPKRFNFIADADTTVDGFLAHEAQAVVPEAVTGTHNEVDDDGNPVLQGIDQAKLVPLLTGALQEAIAKIEALETEMTALKARVTTLENA